jgi:hypothetical protein
MNEYSALNYANSVYNAVGIAEGWIEAESYDEVLGAWQYLVNTGVVWQLQGWFGRTAAQLIENGEILRKDEWMKQNACI